MISSGNFIILFLIEWNNNFPRSSLEIFSATAKSGLPTSLIKTVSPENKNFGLF
jgi:hypothetical protein